MNKISIKLLSVLAIILFVAVIPVVVFATNENLSVVSTTTADADENEKTEYIIYIKDYTDKKFKYALSNNANPEVMDLVYINSITDLGENQVAFIDAETYDKLSNQNQTIYMWAKDENENLILNGIQLDLTKSFSKEEIDSVESITKRISVEIADTEEATDATEPVREEDVDGVRETAKVGYVKITDNEDAIYYYQRVKTADSVEFATLMDLAERINNEYDALDMYEKVQLGEEFYNLYSKLVEEANWQEVENMTIGQPEQSVAGDEYVVLLRMVDGEQEIVDAQFLTAYDDYKPNVVKEQVVTQETTRLPITYDSIALIVVLAVIVIALVVVFIRMKKVSKKDEEK